MFGEKATIIENNTEMCVSVYGVCDKKSKCGMALVKIYEKKSTQQHFEPLAIVLSNNLIYELFYSNDKLIKITIKNDSSSSTRKILHDKDFI